MTNMAKHETALTVSIPLAAVRVQAPEPSHLSQLNVQTCIGIGKRQYLESMPAFAACGGKVLRLGRLRIVERAAYLAWLGERNDREQHESGEDDVTRLADELGIQV